MERIIALVLLRYCMYGSFSMEMLSCQINSLLKNTQTRVREASHNKSATLYIEGELYIKRGRDFKG